MRTFSPRRRLPDRPSRRAGSHAFTLLELLVSLVVLLLVLVALLQFTTNAQQVWLAGSADPFAEAEDALETMVSRAGNATLEPYQDYADNTGAFRTGTAAFTPDHLARRSDLAFACGPSSGANGWLSGSNRTTTTDSVFFLAPQGFTQTEGHLGLERLLDALGFFVEFSGETNAPGFILPGENRWRWRLKEVVQPSESLGIYTSSTALPWVQTLVQASAPISILAENVAGLIVLPERAANDAGAALTADYGYDSRNAGNPLTRHQLPTRLRLALVAIDEMSARVLAVKYGNQPPALIPASLFTDPSKMDADLASLDAQLTAAKINHRILQREIILTSAAWSETRSQ